MDTITYHERLSNFFIATEKNFKLEIKPRIIRANSYLIVTKLRNDILEVKKDLSRYSRLRTIARDELMELQREIEKRHKQLKAISNEYYRLGGKDAQ